MKSLRYVVLLSLAVMLLSSCVGLPPVFPPEGATPGSEVRTIAPEATALVEPTLLAPAPTVPAVQATAAVSETAVMTATAVINPAEPVSGTVEGSATPTSEQVIGANPLVGVVWEWAALLKTKPISQSVVPDPAAYTIVFGERGMVQVKADCNNASGSYTLENNSLTIQLGPTTMAACPPGSLSNVMLTGLSKVGSYLIDGGDLVLRLADTGGSMLFRDGGPSEAPAGQASEPAPVVTVAPTATAAPAPTATVAPTTAAAKAATPKTTEAPAAAASQPALTGTLWQWEKFIDVATGKNNVEVKNPASYTVTFAEDGAAAMKADCNNAAGNYTTDGAKITIDVGPITLAVCGPASLSEMYLINLTSAATYTIENGILNLDMMADGGRMVFSPSK